MNDHPCPKLAKKLAKILGEIGKVEKSGVNQHFKYGYLTENDLVYAVRGRLAEAQIFVFTSIEKQDILVVGEGDNKTALTSVVSRHTFVDGESGESFSVLSQGQGMDNGDKGAYKAATGAMKYFLYKCFMIPTGDDPEADDATDKRAAGGRGQDWKPSETARPAAAPVIVPRTTSTVDERAQFENGKWEKVKIHFGTQYKGKALGELDHAQLTAWLKWEPKPYNNKPISDDDRLLRTALDVAGVETGKTGGRD